MRKSMQFKDFYAGICNATRNCLQVCRPQRHSVFMHLSKVFFTEE